MSFAKQVSHLDPQITACGFFKIGKSLYPTVKQIILEEDTLNTMMILY